MSFDGGNAFQDILAVGGSFIRGGYNRTISTDRGSPIAGRQAWSGNSEGFISTAVNLPFLPPGGRFRWRMASDNSGSGEGWRVDTVIISWCAPVPGCSPTPQPRRTPAPRPLPSAPPSPHDAGVYSGSSPKPVIADQRGRRFAETPYNNSLTSDFSSFSSATDASIFARLKSCIGSRCTISHFTPHTRTGNDEINPCSTP